jgi:hypothetical protein
MKAKTFDIVAKFANSEIEIDGKSFTPTREVLKRFRKYVELNYSILIAYRLTQELPTSKSLTLALRKLWTARSLGIPAKYCPKIITAESCPVDCRVMYFGKRKGVQSALVGVSLRPDIY